MALYLVATPIGHLQDITLRALETLTSADLVVAEDTRQTRKLMDRHGISRPLMRYDEHVHRRMAPGILERLKSGQNVALVTDAGTPGLSDPGQRLAAAAVEAGVPVVPLPGPSALLAALAGAGVKWGTFVFWGFLPRKPGALKTALEKARGWDAAVFYESPFRIIKTLEAVRAHFGDAPVVVARELTKVHEEFLRGPLSAVIENLKKRPAVKGEIAVVVSLENLGEGAEK